MATEFEPIAKGGAIINAITLRPQKELTPIQELLPHLVLVNRVVLINEEGKILLLKRAASDSWQPGLWEIPGGKLDPTQTFEDALERELLEESGYTMIRLSRSAHVQGKMLTQGKYKGFPYMQITGVGKLSGGRIHLSHEHQDHKWASIDEALASSLSPETYVALSEMEEDLKMKYKVV